VLHPGLCARDPHVSARAQPRLVVVSWPSLVVSWPSLVVSWPSLVVSWPSLVVSWPSLVVGWPLHLCEEAGAAVAAVGFRCSDVAAVLGVVAFLEAVSEGPLECPGEESTLLHVLSHTTSHTNLHINKSTEA
jgi:hypothetical protein